MVSYKHSIWTYLELRLSPCSGLSSGICISLPGCPWWTTATTREVSQVCSVGVHPPESPWDLSISKPPHRPFVCWVTIHIASQLLANIRWFQGWWLAPTKYVFVWTIVCVRLYQTICSIVDQLNDIELLMWITISADSAVCWPFSAIQFVIECYFNSFTSIFSISPSWILNSWTNHISLTTIKTNEST